MQTNASEDARQGTGCDMHTVFDDLASAGRAGAYAHNKYDVLRVSRAHILGVPLLKHGRLVSRALRGPPAKLQGEVGAMNVCEGQGSGQSQSRWHA